MRVRTLPKSLLLLSSAVCACLLPTVVAGQTPVNQSEDVVRVTTTLVQTDAMVFDKQGSFVDGLRRDQFVLKIDGKRRDISFFERVIAGSRNEEAQLAAARGNAGATEGSVSTGAMPLDRGRTIFFFADDFHLSPGSVAETRELLLRFVDREMGQNDEVAIASTSGQIGFLQQLTDNKAVLRAAIERLSPRTFQVGAGESPPMSEYQAQKIDQNDDDVVDYFVDHLLKDNPGLPRQMAVETVHSRAYQILSQAASITTNSLGTLESLIRRSSQLPGRKILFLISDGFFLDARNSDAPARLRRITSVAAANGVVIYAIDARGLVSGMEDVSTQTPADPTARQQRGSAGSLMASQDGLFALANETGGRAFFNSNALSAAVTTALKETSAYYLLAWRPENDEQKNPRFRRIEVSVIGRPDLVVRFRRGFGETESANDPSLQANRTQRNDKPADELLTEALRAAYPRSEMPVALSLNFIDDPRAGLTLAAALKVSTRAMKLERTDAGLSANLDVTGTVLDDQGKSVSAFNKRLTIKAGAGGVTNPPDYLRYYHLARVKPGLYQIRVAVLDVGQRRAGSTAEWIVIPNLSSKALAMSSLMVGEKAANPETQQIDGNSKEPNAADNPFRDIELNIDHSFARSSRLRFLTFIYNATRSGSNASLASGSALPTSGARGMLADLDLAVQVQVFRDNEPVITSPLQKIETAGITDLARVPYAADVLLDTLRPGRYVLQVTIIDRLAKTSISQRYDFRVD